MKIDWNSIDRTELTHKQYWREHIDGDYFTEDSIFYSLKVQFHKTKLEEHDLKLLRKAAKFIFENSCIQMDGFRDLCTRDGVIVIRSNGGWGIEIDSGSVKEVSVVNQGYRKIYKLNFVNSSKEIYDGPFTVLTFKYSRDSKAIVEEFYKRKGLYHFFEQRRDWTIFNECDYPDNPNEIQDEP